MNDLTIFDRADLVPADAGDVLPLSQNPAVVYIMALSAGSQRTMRMSLTTIAQLLGYPDLETCPWHELRAQHTSVLRGLLQERYAVATVNKMLSALRGVLHRAWEMDLITTDVYQRAVNFKNVEGSAAPVAAGRSLTQRELNRLMEVCLEDDGTGGQRDAAIIAVAYATGARRAELVGLDLADVTREEGTLKVVIRGKGKKTRTTYMRAPLSDALLDWMQLRGAEPGPLFLRLQHGGRPMSETRRLSTQAIYEMLLARGTQAGIERFSPHDLRRTCISNHLDAGTDITTVAGIVGHSNVQTTARYDRRAERAKRDAAGNVHIAYRRRDER